MSATVKALRTLESNPGRWYCIPCLAVAAGISELEMLAMAAYTRQTLSRSSDYELQDIGSVPADHPGRRACAPGGSWRDRLLFQQCGHRHVEGLRELRERLQGRIALEAAFERGKIPLAEMRLRGQVDLRQPQGPPKSSHDLPQRSGCHYSPGKYRT